MAEARPCLVVTGAGGQLGRALAGLKAPMGWDRLLLTRQRLDITDAAAIDAALAPVRSGLIVNASAYTAVDKAESEPELAQAVNGDGVAHLGRAAARRGWPMVHLSTDFVFDGTKAGAYDETDAPAPLSVYGASKRAGEQALQSVLPRHVILRTAWVFSRDGACFPRAIHNALRQRDEVSVVDDQVGCPTAAEHLAAILLAIAPRLLDRAPDDPLFGLYHLAGQPVLSRFAFAQAIEAEMRRQGVAITGRVVPRQTDPNAPGAIRPANSALSSARFSQTFGIAAPDWRMILPDCIAAYAGEGKTS